MARAICIQKFNTILDDYDKCQKIEESIYNFTVEQSKKKGIENNIDNKLFKRIYVNKVMNLFNNIDNDSYIDNIDLREKIFR